VAFKVFSLKHCGDLVTVRDLQSRDFFINCVQFRGVCSVMIIKSLSSDSIFSLSTAFISEGFYDFYYKIVASCIVAPLPGMMTSSCMCYCF